MGTWQDSLNAHYGRPGLDLMIRDAFAAAGLTPGEVTLDHLADLDQFHLRGLEATRELAALAELKPGLRVLDAGCGLGGPARTLAADFGCTVVGLEIVEDFCRAAAMLSEWVGLADKVAFRVGDMRAMPFAAGAFDLIISQHTVMNIEDKGALFAEMRRVLRPGGRLLLHEVCGDQAADLHYPVPWASDPGISFLVSAAELRRLIVGAGFTEQRWVDQTPATRAWFDRIAAVRSREPAQPRLPNLGLVMGAEAAVKSRNLRRNLVEDRLGVVQGVFGG